MFGIVGLECMSSYFRIEFRALYFHWIFEVLAEPHSTLMCARKSFISSLASILVVITWWICQVPLIIAQTFYLFVFFPVYLLNVLNISLFDKKKFVHY